MLQIVKQNLLDKLKSTIGGLEAVIVENVELDGMYHCSSIGNALALLRGACKHLQVVRDEVEKANKTNRK
jgi:hypothetical protein